MSRDKLILIISDFKQFVDVYSLLNKIYGKRKLIFINSTGYVINELNNKNYMSDLSHYPLHVYLI